MKLLIIFSVFYVIKSSEGNVWRLFDQFNPNIDHLLLSDPTTCAADFYNVIQSAREQEEWALKSECSLITSCHNKVSFSIEFMGEHPSWLISRQRNRLRPYGSMLGSKT